MAATDPATERQAAAIDRLTSPERLARLSKADATVLLDVLNEPKNMSRPQRAFLWRLTRSLQPNEVGELIDHLRAVLRMTDGSPIPPQWGEPTVEGPAAPPPVRQSDPAWLTGEPPARNARRAPRRDPGEDLAPARAEARDPADDGGALARWRERFEGDG
ncbi:MAG: hypothetical protein ABII82_13355 [Verrucomicrobiota bacterium]